MTMPNATGTSLAQALFAQRALADEMPVLVMTADPDGTVNFFNRMWFDYTGQDRFERDTEARWTQYLHPDDVARVANDWAEQVGRGSDVVQMDYRVLHARTNTFRWLTARATALRDESGNIVQWIGTAMDVHDAHTAGDSATQVADAYQRTSLPVLPAELNGLHFDVVYRSSTSRLTACGDWYDAFPLNDRQTAICIGDVRGHGIDAAVLMLKYRQMIRALTLRIVSARTGDMADILAGVENTIDLEHPGACATAFLGILSADRSVLSWSCAGHIPPLLLNRDGTTRWLDRAQDPPLGERFQVQRRVRETPMRDVAAIVLCTDGLVESSRNLVEGMSQLETFVRAHCDAPDLASSIMSAWPSQQPADDVAILSVRLEGLPPSSC